MVNDGIPHRLVEVARSLDGRPMNRNPLVLPLVIGVFLASLIGCGGESREYLSALEAKSRLIERSHKVRRDIIDSLGRRNLALADQAMEAEVNIEEESIYLEGRLDTLRPHRPDAARYAESSQLIQELERQRSELQEQWVAASRSTDPERAKDLSAKIRDIEMSLADASEICKQSKPLRVGRESSTTESRKSKEVR